MQVYNEETEQDEWQYYWSGFGDRDITLTPVTAEPLTPPADLKTEKWVWKDEYDNGFVDVGFTGNEVWINGMDRDLPDAWIKGTVEGDKIKFASGQYLGPDFDILYLSYFYGAKLITTEPEDPDEAPVMTAELLDFAEFSYDVEKKFMSLDTDYVINSSPDRAFPLYAYQGVTVELQNRNVNAVPATPYDLEYSYDDYSECGVVWVQIPQTDVDGNLLDAEKLFYTISLDGKEFTFSPDDYMDIDEETTLVPYKLDGFDFYVEGTDHTVYLYGADPKESVSVRSVYFNENGEKLESAPVTEDLSSVEAIEAGEEVAVEWTDLQGRRVSRPANGVFIRTARYADGSVRHTKVMVK